MKNYIVDRWLIDSLVGKVIIVVLLSVLSGLTKMYALDNPDYLERAFHMLGEDAEPMNDDWTLLVGKTFFYVADKIGGIDSINRSNIYIFLTDQGVSNITNGERNESEWIRLATLLEDRELELYVDDGYIGIKKVDGDHLVAVARKIVVSNRILKSFGEHEMGKIKKAVSAS